MDSSPARPPRGPVIAIDGPAASGKGTIARAVARHFHVPHLDTGALYRAVGLAALRSGIRLDDAVALADVAAALDLSLLEDPALRSDETAAAASAASAVPGVRAALIGFQRDFARQPGGAVLDGRDIGTVIAPEADAKLFITAAPAVRAGRRHRELQQAGRDTSAAAVLADIAARDRRDSERSIAPLRQAPDADLLDTSEMDIMEAVRQAVHLISRRLEHNG
jgi:cytidylate kinase